MPTAQQGAEDAIEGPSRSSPFASDDYLVLPEMIPLRRGAVLMFCNLYQTAAPTNAPPKRISTG